MAAPRYRKLNPVLRAAFGEKVYRIGLRCGFTCPNRDGSRGEGGCIFCNQESSEPLGHIPGEALSDQLAFGTEYIRERHGARKFIAFFSGFSATYGEVEQLEALYREACSYPGIVGLALGTRPDCLPAPVLDLLQAISRETFLWVELGIQSCRESTLESIGRRHTVEESRRAIEELRGRGIAVSGHVILGLPGETVDDMLETAGFLAANRVQGAKIHNLHVLKETPLADLYAEGRYTPLKLEEYVDLAVRFLEHLPPDIVIQRITGEAPRRLTVAPGWSVNKLAVMNAVRNELRRRETWQGRATGHAQEELSLPVEIPGLPGPPAGKIR